MIEFFFDFETRSRVDLKKFGAVNYARDPSTEATLLTWCFDVGPVKEWRYGQPIPREIQEVAERPEKYKFIAHNVEFDYLIWTYVFIRELKAEACRIAPGKLCLVPQAIPFENLMCTQAMGQRYCAGRGLEAVAKILHVPLSKDPEGRRIMLKQCKVNKKTNEFPELTHEEWEHFSKYGKLDTVMLRKVYRILPKLSPSEFWAWQWTLKRNLAGIKLDMKLVHGMAALLRIELPKLNNEFNTIVGHQFVVTQRAKCLTWFQQYIPTIQDMRSDTIRDLVAEPPEGVPRRVIRALEIKSTAGSASVKKVHVALTKSYQGRIYQNLVYNGAHTKRWAGMGLQVHNFPRAKYIPGGIEEAIHLLKYDPITASELSDIYYDGNIELVKSLLRRMFVPDDGLAFYCGDYSKIEPTVLFWLVGLGDIPKNWYEQMASEIFTRPLESITKEGVERQLGKKTALGCGYGMGHVKFKIQCKIEEALVISTDLAKTAVTAYRKKYAPVTKFWYMLSAAFSNAVTGQTTALCGGKIEVAPMAGRCRGVSIKLPSGSRLFYHDASYGDEGLIFKQAQQGTIRDKHTYGGLLTEHVVSATARDIMLSGMFHAERAGFQILNTVHDELWAQAKTGKLEEFDAAMLTLPKWAEGVKLTVDSSEGIRYLK